MTHEKEDPELKLEFSGVLSSGPRETVADLLRRARIDCGQDLRAVAGVLRIRLTYLEAIESGEFDRLPGATYAVGFLRTYAEYLGLDGEQMVERFKAETQAAARRSELIFPEPVAEGRIPGGAIILVSLILLAAAYGGWFYLSQQGRTVADLLPAWPTQTQTATPVPGATSAETASATTSEPAPAPAPAPAPVEAPDASIVTSAAAQANAPVTADAGAPAATTSVAETPAPAPQPAAATASSSPQTAETVAPEPIETAPAQAPASPVTSSPANARAPASAPTPAETTPAPAPAAVAALSEDSVLIPEPPLPSETVIIPDDQSPRVYGGNNEESRITLRAVRDTWVQVRDSQDAILLTRVLRAGDTYRVPDATGLSLLTGDAGGIELEVDGVRLPPIGPSGVVRRNIALDPAQLLSGATTSR